MFVDGVKNVLSFHEPLPYDKNIDFQLFVTRNNIVSNE